MKAYILFSGPTFYPGGGWEDYKGVFDTIQEARDSLDTSDDWFQIVDTETMEIVATELDA